MNPTISLSLTRSFRDLTTHDLIAERECWSWDLADVTANPETWRFAESTGAYISAKVADLDSEIARRRRLAGKPHSPVWPKSPEDRADELAEIKRRLELVAFIESYTPVRFRKVGDEYLAVCPFLDHDDSTPSFYVHPGKQLFHCFGCGRGGDIFEFTRHFLGLANFTDVADVLRRWAGLPDYSTIPVPIPIGNSGIVKTKKTSHVALKVRHGKIEPR